MHPPPHYGGAAKNILHKSHFGSILRKFWNQNPILPKSHFIGNLRDSEKSKLANTKPVTLWNFEIDSFINSFVLNELLI